MPARLALINYPARRITLDPNQDNFGIPPHILHDLCYHPDGRRKTISTGVLQCQRCIDVGRTSTSVHLRKKPGSDDLVIAHHGSHTEGPCYALESDEHKAWKERIAKELERAGFTAQIESSASDRTIRSDVIASGHNGRRIGWEIQLSEIGAGLLTRRTNHAVNNGITPSWLTTDTSATSKTRPLINRVPWSMTTEMTAAQIVNGSAAWVHGSVHALRDRRCKELPGNCPNPPHGRWTYDCGKWHPVWEQTPLYVEDFIAQTAAGLYIPIPILSVDRASVARWWVTPQDRDRYANEERPCTEEALPAHLRLLRSGRSRSSGSGTSTDSLLHQTKRPLRKQKRVSRAPGVINNPVVPVDTISAPCTIGENPGGSGAVPAHLQQRLRWLDAAEPLPCCHWVGDEQRSCEATPTRLYAQGRRCIRHTPARLQGKPEPGEQPS